MNKRKHQEDDFPAESKRKPNYQDSAETQQDESLISKIDLSFNLLYQRISQIESAINQLHTRMLHVEKSLININRKVGKVSSMQSQEIDYSSTYIS